MLREVLQELELALRAQWTSSNTRASAARGRALDEPPRREEEQPRLPQRCGAGASPSRSARYRPVSAASCGEPRRRRGELLAREIGRIGLEDPAHRGQAGRPGSPAPPVGKTAAPQNRPPSPHERGHSRQSRDLPMPGGPTTVTRCGRRSVTPVQKDRSARAPGPGRRGAPPAGARPAATRLDSEPGGTGSALPLASIGALVADRVTRGAVCPLADDQPPAARPSGAATRC